MSLKSENSRVLQKAILLSVEIRNLTRRFTKKEQRALCAHIKRACDSIILNIVGGSTGSCEAECKRFILYALRSVIDLIACLHVAKHRSLIHHDAFERLYAKAEEILEKLHELRKAADLKEKRQNEIRRTQRGRKKEGKRHDLALAGCDWSDVRR